MGGTPSTWNRISLSTSRDAHSKIYTIKEVEKEFMKIIYKISEFQPTVVGIVAVAYIGASIAGKIMCDENQFVIERPFQMNYINSCPIVCHEPKEMSIPIAFVAGTSGDAEVFTVPLV